MISIYKTSNANPTNTNPNTLPPLNATTNALCKLNVASLHVRTFALTAIFMPM